MMQIQQDACVKAGEGRTLQARLLLSRILKDTACLNCLPVAQRLSPCSLAMVALAGTSALLLHQTAEPCPLPDYMCATVHLPPGDSIEA